MAEFLCRDVEELHAKLRQLGLAPASQHNDLCTSADMTPKRAVIYGACIAAAFVVLLLVRYRETLWGLWIWLWT